MCLRRDGCKKAAIRAGTNQGGVVVYQVSARLSVAYADYRSVPCEQARKARSDAGLLRGLEFAAAGSENARMPISLPDLVGFAAATLTTVAFVPQALKSWRTRDLSGVSLTMYGLFTLGVALWLVYGIFLGSWPIILANIVTLALSGMVLLLKVRHRKGAETR